MTGEPENPAYTFETFIVSASSQVAFSASVAVAEHSEHAHNPLFLHGPTGSGKSHLLHAIAQTMRSQDPDANILRIPAAAYLAALIDAIRANHVQEFRREIAEVDALLLDDVRFDADRERTREEFLIQFEELSNRGVPVVATSDDIHFVEQQIRRRFGKGLIAEIRYPDMAARIEIARRTAAKQGVALSDDGLRRLARRATGNPRELHGRIARIAAEAAIVRR